jgi:hypothetical protein
MVGKGVEHRTSRARVAVCRCDILWPSAFVTRSTFGYDVSFFEPGSEQIRHGNGVVPRHDRELDQAISHFADDTHSDTGN